MDKEIKEFELAHTYISKGNFNEAKKIYIKLIKEGSRNHLVFGNLAIIFGLEEDLNSMYGLLKEAIKINPNYHDGHNNLGFYYTKKKDYKSAISSYKNALNINPYLTETYYNLGVIYKNKGDINEAKKNYKEAIKINPGYFNAHYNLGLIYKENDDFDNAIKSFDIALGINPNSSETYNNLGIIFLKKDNIDKAILYFQKSINLKSDNHEAFNNLGISYERKGHYELAIEALNRSLKINKNYAEAFFNLGNAQKASGKINEAIISYSSAFKIKPNYQEAHFNYSLVLFLANKYKNAWEEFEWRFVNNFIVPHVVPTTKKWAGEKLNKNEKLTVVSEQGLGDTIHFMRFLPYFAKIGYQIDFIVDKRLHSIIKASDINGNPISPNEFNKLSLNKWLPLMSLGKILEINPLLKSFDSPYIKTNYEFDLKWKRNLSAVDKPIIGINWQGNNKIEIGAFKGRSLPLELFSSILQGIDIKLISLQKGFGSEQLQNCSFKDKFVDCQDEIEKIWDFLELSSIMKNCSLIITSDTCVAHLAGALGIKTWLLLKKVPDWRWGINGKETFWYSSIKIFRQENEGNWKEVLLKVSDELRSEKL